MSSARLHLTPAQFLEYTPQELAGVLYYWHQDEEAKMKNAWEQTRIQTYLLINIQLDRKTKLTYKKFATDIWKFEWEKDVKGKENPEEGMMNMDQWNAIINKPKEATSQIPLDITKLNI